MLHDAPTVTKSFQTKLITAHMLLTSWKLNTLQMGNMLVVPLASQVAFCVVCLICE